MVLKTKQLKEPEKGEVQGFKVWIEVRLEVEP